MSAHPAHSAGDVDVEVGAKVGEKPADSSASTKHPFEAGVSEVVSVRDKSTIFSKLRKIELWLDKKLKVEPMGIDRIPEDQRRPPSTLNVRSGAYILAMRLQEVHC